MRNMSDPTTWHRSVAPDRSIPNSIENLTPSWLTDVLRAAGELRGDRVESIRTEVIGEGTGFSSHLTRLMLEYADKTNEAPESLVAKLPSLNRRKRAWMELFQGYEREILFFEQLVGKCTLSTPRCYYAAMDTIESGSTRSRDRKILQRLPAWIKDVLLSVALWVRSRSKRRYVLLLEDLNGFRVGDQLAGASLEDAAIAARSLGELHAGFWADPALAELGWLPQRLGTPEWIRSTYRRHSDRFYRELDEPLPAHIRPLMDWADGQRGC